MELILWRLNAPPDPKAGMEAGHSADSRTANYQHLKTLRTNQDGRTEAPLLEGEDFQIGFYEIVFLVGDYFSQRAPNLSTQHPFLNLVPIHFGVEKSSTHYHVPLLVSPWSYSTYRGS